MKAFAIAIPSSKVSMAGFEELKESYDKYGHEEGIELFEAISIKQAVYYLKQFVKKPALQKTSVK